MNIRRGKWALAHRDNLHPAVEGELMQTNMGETWCLVAGTPPHKPSSSGYVFVTDSDGGGREFYAHVFELVWIDTGEGASASEVTSHE